MRFHDMRRCAHLAAVVVCAMLFSTAANATDADEEKAWESLKPAIFGSQSIADGAAMLAIDAPVRAEDAAVVPVSVRALIPQTPDKFIKSITLVVDENPSPVAAKFTFGPAAASASFSTRLRVNSYSYVRAVAELNDGTLWMQRVFVKASGGCSAPALKDEDNALANLGQMKFLEFAGAAEGSDGGSAETRPLAVADGTPAMEAQIMIRHPNYSGLQMDQVTMLYIPARFVQRIEVRRGDDLVFKMEGGISLSENPAIRFTLRKDGKGSLTVNAADTDNKAFNKSWPVKAGGA